VLNLSGLLFSELGFLVLLDEVTSIFPQLAYGTGYKINRVNERSAIAGAETVGTSISLDVILFTHFSTLHHLKYPLASQMHQAVVCTAVKVAEAVGIHRGVLVETVVDFSVDDAWAAFLDYC
jgi:hypothetical protein